jgi:hypothetical protein
MIKYKFLMIDFVLSTLKDHDFFQLKYMNKIHVSLKFNLKIFRVLQKNQLKLY